jgi:hypothetical protein
MDKTLIQLNKKIKEEEEINKYNWFENVNIRSLIQSNKLHFKRSTILERFNPPIKVKEIKVENKIYHLIDDGELFGGTKIRFMIPYVAEIKEKEIIYAGPDSGMAQIVLGVAGILFNKKVTVFVNTYKDMKYKPYLVHFGMKYLNINYDFSNDVKGRTLKSTQECAEAYYNSNPKDKYMIPFGLLTDEFVKLFTKILTESLKNISPPNRLWLVVGSGMILKTLQNIWPSTEYQCVQVGKKVYNDQLRGTDVTEPIDKLYIAPEYFSVKAIHQPPYDSIPWYDAKLWQFVLTNGKDGDYIWNVASLPTEYKLKEFLAQFL